MYKKSNVYLLFTIRCHTSSFFELKSYFSEKLPEKYFFHKSLKL